MILDMSGLSPLSPMYNACATHVYSTADSTLNFDTVDRRNAGSTPQQSGYDSPQDPDSWRSRPWELIAEPVSGNTMPAETNTSAALVRRKARKSGKSSYKHVPHREKPPHLVARRNARERRRVQAVNSAFSRLRKSVPNENRNKRLSKVKTLHRAIEYIQNLQEMLDQADAELCQPSGHEASSLLMDGNLDVNYTEERGKSILNKENEAEHRWISLDDANWDNDTHSSCLSFYDDFGEQLQS